MHNVKGEGGEGGEGGGERLAKRATVMVNE